MGSNAESPRLCKPEYENKYNISKAMDGLVKQNITKLYS